MIEPSASCRVLSLASVVAKNEGFIEVEIDNEVVALNIKKGTCYALNAVGSRAWNLIKTRARIQDICTQLQTEFRVEPLVCERQVLDLLEELRAERMIVEANEL